MAVNSTSRLIELQPLVKINTVISGPNDVSRSSNLPSLVFLHFWGGSSDTWSEVTALIAPHYPTIAIDFRGWGQSTGPADERAYSIKDLANDVEEVLQSLALDSVIIVGLSMGAKVAQFIAGRGNFPALKGIVLVSPAPPTPLVLPPDMKDQQIHAYDTEQTSEFVVRNVLTAIPLSTDAVSSLVRGMVRGNRWAKAAWPAFVMAEDISEIATKITLPVLVIGAENDAVEPLSRVQAEVVGNIPEARFAVVPKSGHLSPLEAPDVVSGFIINFIQNL